MTQRASAVWGPTCRMPLVRMCTVTASLFRMCMCLCLRARDRERREASSKASDAELVPICDPSEVGPSELQLTTITEDLQFSERPLHILEELNLSNVLQADDLRSLVGPYSPKRQLAGCKEPTQDKPSHKRHPRTGLQWLSSCEHDDSAGQDEHRVTVGEEVEEKADRHLVRSPFESPIGTHTIAWSDCDSCVVGSPTCAAYTPKWPDAKLGAEDGAGERPKTLEDELLEAAETTDAHRACFAGSRGSCQWSQLPNQIPCTVNLLIEDGAEEQVREEDLQ